MHRKCWSGNALDAANVSLMFLFHSRICHIRVMWLRLVWPRKLVCTSWQWLNEAQVDTITVCRSCCYWRLDVKCFLKTTCPYLCLPLSSSPGRGGAESTLPSDLSSVLPLPQLEGGTQRTHWWQPSSRNISLLVMKPRSLCWANGPKLYWDKMFISVNI